MPHVPAALDLAFITLCLAVAALVPSAVAHALPAGTPRRGPCLRAGLAVALFLAVPALVAAGGLLAFGTTPPRLPLLLLLLTAVTCAAVASRHGARLTAGLSMAALVGFQVFRVPVELLLHRLYLADALPVQMTFAGYNFDILTGLSALPVAWLYAGGRISDTALWVWNTLCLGLLVTVVAIAVLSMPLPIRQFAQGPALTLPTTFPYIWLPGVLVQAALAGHLLLYRKLRAARASDS